MGVALGPAAEAPVAAGRARPEASESRAGLRARQRELAPDEPGRKRVVELQRARIIVAMGELVREQGVSGVTIAHIVARSGISRRTYYELFNDREDCLLATFDDAVERAAAAVLPAYRSERGGAWEDQLRAGLGALLRFLDDEPALAGLLVVDALAAERYVLDRRARLLDALVDAVHRGATVLGSRAAARSVDERDAAREPGRASVGDRQRAPARIVAEGVVGAVFAVIHARLLADRPAVLGGLLNQLMAMIVLPYRGTAAARRELARPRPRARRRAAVLADPLREIDLRLTYRTIRVLLAIAELGASGPAPNGRKVADASGVSDQGQISKLLARLAHVGLIHNTVGVRAKGEPNAWLLTDRGAEVVRAIRAQTSSSRA